MHADVRALKEQGAAAHAIVEARAAAREVLNDSDHDASPQNGFDGISDEAVAEAGYESEESEEEAWWAFSEGPKSAPGPWPGPQFRQVRLARSCPRFWSYVLRLAA